MSLITRDLTIRVTSEEEHFDSSPASESIADDLIALLTDASRVELLTSTEVPEYRLHVGMHAMQFLRADHRAWQADGDGWNSWGEDRGVDLNDDVTAHVMWQAAVTLEEADRIVRDAASLLAPMTGDVRTPGCIAVVTNWDVWSEDQDAHWIVENGAVFMMRKQATS